MTFDASLSGAELLLNSAPVQGPGLEQASAFLNLVLQMADLPLHAQVESNNNFPITSRNLGHRLTAINR